MKLVTTAIVALFATSAMAAGTGTTGAAATTGAVTQTPAATAPATTGTDTAATTAPTTGKTAKAAKTKVWKAEDCTKLTGAAQTECMKKAEAHKGTTTHQLSF